MKNQKLIEELKEQLQKQVEYRNQIKGKYAELLELKDQAYKELCSQDGAISMLQHLIQKEENPEGDNVEQKQKKETLKDRPGETGQDKRSLRTVEGDSPKNGESPEDPGEIPGVTSK